MSKREWQQNIEYIEDVGNVIASLSCRDKLKYEFSKKFVHELQLTGSVDDNRIQIGPLDSKILEYFIFSILVEYEHSDMESTYQETSGANILAPRPDTTNQPQLKRLD